MILITGSGGHDRDETLFEHKPFLVLADYLTRRGIAVLRLDDRGVGGSKAPTVKGTLADIASDVDAGVGWLRRRPDIDPRRIGLIGHSEGGIIAPMVASTEPSVAFIVLLEGPATRMAAVVSNQARAIKLAGGAPPTVAEGTGRLEAQILDALLANPDPKAAREAIDKVLANAHASPLNDAAFATMNSAVYRDLMGYDPRAALRKLRIPVLGHLRLQRRSGDRNSERSGHARRSGQRPERRDRGVAGAKPPPATGHHRRCRRIRKNRDHHRSDRAEDHRRLRRVYNLAVRQLSMPMLVPLLPTQRRPLIGVFCTPCPATP